MRKRGKKLREGNERMSHKTKQRGRELCTSSNMRRKTYMTEVEEMRRGKEEEKEEEEM